MKALRTQLFPRILKFWALHLAMAVVGGLGMAVNDPIQAAFSPELAVFVSFAVSIGITALYFTVFLRAANKLLRSLREGFLFGFAGALPMFLIILWAISYLQRVPHNTIGYSFILLPVTLPFQGWIEHLHPALPFHLLALATPAVFIAAILMGSSLQQRN